MVFPPLGIHDLEVKIDKLIQICDDLERQRAILEADCQRWQQEQGLLEKKNELAKSKLKAMLQRLKALEQAP